MSLIFPHSPPPKEVIAYHGWGFDASCWYEWQSQFDQQGWTFQSFDRGYWQQAIEPTFNPFAQTKMVMVHSYGLHLCPITQLQQADVLVILSSFAEFHSTSVNKQRSRQMLQQMIDQFRLHPESVLSQFRVKCYHPFAWQGTISASINSELLLHDLNQLQTASLDLALLQPIPKILILHGSQDRIVSSAQGAELAARLVGNGQNCQYYAIDAGHALPFTHLDGCWSMLHTNLENGFNGLSYE